MGFSYSSLNRSSVWLLLIVLRGTVAILRWWSIILPVVSNHFDRLLRGTFIVVLTLSKYPSRDADQHHQYQQFLNQLLHTGIASLFAFTSAHGREKEMRQPSKEQDRCHNLESESLRFFARKPTDYRQYPHRFRGNRTLWCNGNRPNCLTGEAGKNWATTSFYQMIELLSPYRHTRGSYIATGIERTQRNCVFPRR